MTSNRLRYRIGRLQLQRAKADCGRSVPSKALLALLKDLEGVSKEQLLEVMSLRVVLGD